MGRKGQNGHKIWQKEQNWLNGQSGQKIGQNGQNAKNCFRYRWTNH